MEKPIIILDNVTKRFGSFVAVDDFCFEVGEGEFVTLLGPSGCGKTTTLRMMAGLESPTAGTIYLDGKDVTNVPPSKRPVNMVFQSYALFPHMTVFENVAFGPSIRKVGKKQIRTDVEAMLGLVRLGGFESRYVTKLSGGQAQRVALARALINRPRILLLDEPLGALDLKLRKEMQLELKLIQRRLNITFIYVTHDQEEALVMSDRIVVMNKGRIAQAGTGRELYESPTSAFVSSFIGDTNLLEGKVATLSKSTTVVEASGLTINILPGKEFKVGKEVSLSLRPEHVRILQQSPRVPEENIFPARVENIVYVGPDMRLQLRLECDKVILLRTSATDEKSAYHLGDLVWIQLPVEHIVVVAT